MADQTIAHNKSYFDSEALSYDANHSKTIDQLIGEIRKRRSFIGADWVDDLQDEEDGPGDAAVESPPKPVRLLDYACGTGLVSRALAPYTTQCVGVDLSENMVQVYNTSANNQGLTQDEMHAVQANLLDPNDPDPAAFQDPKYTSFDVAAVGLGFHHFADPDLAAQRLASRLRPGGVLFIVDFLPHGAEDISSSGAADTVVHHGFTPDRVRAVFEQAGVGEEFALEEMGSGVVFRGRNSQGHGHGQGHGHVHHHGHSHGEDASHDHGAVANGQTMRRRVFIARGQKPR